MITEEQKKRYLDSDGTECPFCGDVNYRGGEVIFGKGDVTQTMSCNGCGKVWYDVYKLTNIEEGD